MSEADEATASGDEREPLTDDELMRGVPPSFVDQRWSMDEPNPRVFWPRDEDDGELSVDLESVRTPEDTYEHRTKLGLKTAGILAVSVDDVAHVELAAYSDPLPDNDAHGFVDFRPRLNEKVVREILMKRALARGWRFVAE